MPCYFEGGGVATLSFGIVYKGISNSSLSHFKPFKICINHKEFLFKNKLKKSFQQRHVCCKYLKIDP